MSSSHSYNNIIVQLGRTKWFNSVSLRFNVTPILQRNLISTSNVTNETNQSFKFKFIPSVNNSNHESNTTNLTKKWSSHSLPSRETLLKHENIQKEKEMRDRAQLEEAKKIVAMARESGNISNSQIDTVNNTTTNTPLKKRKRKLRARKAVISLTPTAISHLKALLELPEPKMIRVSTKNRGCSGTQYDLSYVTKAEKFDEIVEQDGIKIIIDSKALFSVVGSEMDWIDDKLNTKFIFKNPNSKGTCGCGESFMT